MEDKDYIKGLFQKYLNGEHNANELKALYDYFGIAGNEAWLSRLIQEHLESEQEIIDLSENTRIKHIVQERWDSISTLTAGNKNGKSLLGKWITVAALLIGIGLVSMYYLITKQEVKSTTLTSMYGSDVLAPVASRATLVLSDGRTIQLDSTTNGIQIGGSAIAYEKGDLISRTEQVTHATLHVANGNLYNVTLPDGSKVILNSGSSLSYPIRFDDSIRLVKLIGEGFFEVAKDIKHPFKVETTDRQLVTVLGTHFNLKSYQGELTETTLLEGKVALSSDQKNATVILKPGQQSTFDKHTFKIEHVHAEEAVAWSRNLFVFNHMTLREIFKNLERWYDVEFSYPSSLSNKAFMMEIPKDRKLSEILEAISTFEKVTFKIEGRRITVKQE